MFFVYLLLGVFRSDHVSTHLKKIIGSILFLGLVALPFLPRPYIPQLIYWPSPDFYYAKLIFSNTKTQWYSSYSALGFFAVFAVGTFAAIYSVVKKRYYVLGFALLSFVVNLYLLTFPARALRRLELGH